MGESKESLCEQFAKLYCMCSDPVRGFVFVGPAVVIWNLPFSFCPPTSWQLTSSRVNYRENRPMLKWALLAAFLMASAASLLPALSLLLCFRGCLGFLEPFFLSWPKPDHNQDNSLHFSRGRSKTWAEQLIPPLPPPKERKKDAQWNSGFVVGLDFEVIVFIWCVSQTWLHDFFKKSLLSVF